MGSYFVAEVLLHVWHTSFFSLPDPAPVSEEAMALDLQHGEVRPLRRWGLDVFSEGEDEWCEFWTPSCSVRGRSGSRVRLLLSVAFRQATRLYTKAKYHTCASPRQNAAKDALRVLVNCATGHRAQNLRGLSADE